MRDLFFPHALLPGGWARDVRLRVDAGGAVAAVAPSAPPEGSERVPGVAIPGVPNLHSHAFQRALAGFAERGNPSGDSFWSWRERMYAFLERLGPDDVEAIAAQLFVEMLRHGFTSVCEFHYLRNDVDGRPYANPAEMAGRIAAAAREAGMGLTLLPVLYRTSDFGGAPPTPGQRRFVAGVDELLADVQGLAAATEADPNAAVGLGLHSLRAVTPADVREALAALDGLLPGAPVHIHVAEQLREVEACLAWSGARPVAWLLDHAPVDARWCLVHATHMEDAEARGMAARGAVAGLCPTTEANLGDGLFDLPRFLGAQGAWGVGTDSHVSVSPVAELRTLEYGQRIALRARNVVAGARDASTGRTLLEGAWRGGAAAAGRPVGRLDAGARADVVVLDPDHPVLVGRADDALLDAWIFSGEDTPVREVMVGGRWVVRSGRHDRQDEVAARFRATMERLASE